MKDNWNLTGSHSPIVWSDVSETKLSRSLFVHVTVCVCVYLFVCGDDNLMVTCGVYCSIGLSSGEKGVGLCALLDKYDD